MENKEKDILKDGERLDDLQIKDLKIIQNPEMFSFGMDSVLLANFVKIKNKKQKLMDLCTGTGIIPLIIAGKRDIDEIDALEIQENVADMANRSVIYNNLQEKIKIIEGDIKKVRDDFPHQSYDIISVNPPYMPPEKMSSISYTKAVSKQEIKMDLNDLFLGAKHLLKPNGKMYMVHRPSRLVDIFSIARLYKIEPKEIGFVHPKADKPSNLVLIEFSKGGRAELKILENLYVYDENGEYTNQIKEIYS